MEEDTKEICCSVLLLYPDSLAAVYGAPGFREVYRSLSQEKQVQVDWGWYDVKKECVAYERREVKRNYDCIAFSVPFELLYFNVVKSLTSLGIEPARHKRGPDKPVVMIGGTAPTLNPAVAGVIADSVYIGEAEPNITVFLRESILNKKRGAVQQLTPMRGTSVPKKPGTAPRFIYQVDKIDSTFLDGFDNPSLSTFRGAGLIEVGRGCSRGCRFCAAGHVYLPVRHRDVDDILRDADTYSGKAKRIGLAGASISDHGALKEIMRGILDMGFGLTTSSMRADMLDEELLTLMKKGGLKTVTIAPEGGSERIRRIMNKQLTEEAIFNAVRACKTAGIKNIRLYFMVGLPWEKEADVMAIVELVEKIRREFGGSQKKITISVNPFIPKPQTPFQWCGMADTSYIKKVYKILSRAFHGMKGVTLKKLSIRAALKEAIISLGDEAVGNAIIDNQCDGLPWNKALSMHCVDKERLVHSMKSHDERFPWDHVTGEKTKAALFASFMKAKNTAEKY